MGPKIHSFSFTLVFLVSLFLVWMSPSTHMWFVMRFRRYGLQVCNVDTGDAFVGNVGTSDVVLML